MAVIARSDNSAARTAKRGMVDMRRGGLALGGSHLYEGERLVTGWHSHDLHQVEYAVQGVVEVETAAGRYLLPPHQAAWIPAGCDHTTTIHTSVQTVAVLLDPALVPAPGDRVRIISVAPLIREMVMYSLRWPIARRDDDPAAADFFRTLAHLLGDAIDREAPLGLPTSADPVVEAAIAHTHEHLSSVTVAEVSRAVGVSERTLRRRFESTLGLPWRTYLLRARILRSMALLAEPGASVLDASVAVGFENVSSFARAFVRHCGEPPSTYRARVRARETPEGPLENDRSPRGPGADHRPASTTPRPM